ncbi:hypothetical protein OTERR_22380 [Oryzomicrobium terrae]|uniref:HDOD domain-containing protein n=1 Tax=Oryzomicrobium terrae TaxID=1735038 RepID=A0A5C1EAP0_9RHOO|nr:HDOD domain-containing protein [Oryzomicrobium terrae]QEL65714.1 hypothetical protein OTERR_22380 [Oryzomicrobium terrae]
MIETTLPDLDSWVTYFSEHEIPVLRHTGRQLESLAENVDRVNGRDISAVALHDPLMTVRVLAYIQPYRGKRLQGEITTVEQAVMMLGIEPFFRHFSKVLVVEDTLKTHPQALLGLLHVARRAQRASRYAYDWALWRHDLNAEEVRIAALLHDLAEILLWCFAPHLALEIQARQHADRSLRSAVVQDQVLGIQLSELQQALCHAWALPDLLPRLMDDQHASHPRVRNVILAVNLARHSANGWDDAALPDDYTAIGELLNLTPEAVRARVGAPPPEGSADAEAEVTAADGETPPPPPPAEVPPQPQ